MSVLVITGRASLLVQQLFSSFEQRNTISAIFLTFTCGAK
jgi:hypothetical protein